MTPLRFHSIESLHWLWLALAIAALLVYALNAKRAALRRFADPQVWAHLLPSASLARTYVRAALIVGASVALLAALLDPRWGVRYVEMQQRGIDIMFVVDVSRSMLAEDVSPNRLERARQYMDDVIEELGGDRVGLISFAGVAAVKCPLTVDYGALRLSAAELSVESAARGGSLLGDALRLAGESFTDEARDAKVIIVLSDGEDHASYPLEAAQTVHEATGARIFTVGIGDANEGARIPLPGQNSNSPRVWLVHEGQEVWSVMNAEVLREIALAGGGAFVPAGTALADLAAVYRERIAPLGTRQLESGRIEIHNSQYQWFAGLALLLLVMETWMTDRKPRRDFPLEEAKDEP